MAALRADSGARWPIQPSGGPSNRHSGVRSGVPGGSGGEDRVGGLPPMSGRRGLSIRRERCGVFAAPPSKWTRASEMACQTTTSCAMRRKRSAGAGIGDLSGDERSDTGGVERRIPELMRRGRKSTRCHRGAGIHAPTRLRHAPRVGFEDVSSNCRVVERISRETARQVRERKYETIEMFPLPPAQ